VARGHRIPDRAAIELDLDHVVTRRFHRLLNCDRYFARFAATEADAALAVTDDRQRREAENAPAFDDLRDAIDPDELLDESFFFNFLRIGHVLKLQAAFAGGIGQRFDAAVVFETRTIERDARDAGRLRALRDQLAHFCRRILVAGLALTQCG